MARFAVYLNAERFPQARKLSLFKCNVHDGAGNTHNMSDTHYDPSRFRCACAPAEISVISCVIAP